MITVMHVTFFALMMTFLSLWIRKTSWLWGSFLAISYILAFHTGVVQPFSLIPLLTLFILFWALEKPIEGKARWILIAIVTAIAAGLNFHWIPGFHNRHIAGRLWLNYDKPFIGLFPLIFLIPLLRLPDEWYQVAKKAIPLTLLVVVILAALALFAGAIDWHFKIPSHFFLRIVSNLFLVVIPEEAFFRGFFQREIYKGVGEGKKGHIAAIIGASLLFTLFHLGWTSSPAMLAFIFLAGIFYGSIYQYVRAIEASILCHFAVNLFHMMFFTYHAE